MGKRLLRATLLRPLLDRRRDRSPPRRRRRAAHRIAAARRAAPALDGVLDLERLLGRVSLDSAGPRDVLALGASLARLPARRRRLSRPCSQRAGSNRISASTSSKTSTPPSQHSLVAEPPLTLADGGVIAPGVHAELDELRTPRQSGRQSIAAIEERERQRTGIGSLKVRFNNVFGYYIEITKSNLKAVPADYERKQTLVNAERFTTPELKDYETRVLTAQERAIEIERRLFAELRATILAAAPRIRRSAAVRRRNRPARQLRPRRRTARLHPSRPRPKSASSKFAAARHPVVERRMEENAEGRFVPNDLYLVDRRPRRPAAHRPQHGRQMHLSPPGRAARHHGADAARFVPAARMRFGLVDRVYTRIGASDNVARGRSTFMVEMTETAAILNTATTQSLVLLDEMGRGTATYDGLSLAWATRRIHPRPHRRAHALRHPLPRAHAARRQLPRLSNLRVAVKESPAGIVFLHTIEPGAASKSYGIEVARLAGLPASVIERARRVLAQHEKSEKRNVALEAEDASAPLQLTIFTPLSQRIVDRISELDTNSLTPLQALNLLEELKSEIRAGANPDTPSTKPLP